MFAVFHMAGIVPDSYDILNMTVSIGAMNGASSFKTLGVIFWTLIKHKRSDGRQIPPLKSEGLLHSEPVEKANSLSSW
jgi:hypothetical protein